MTVGNYNPAAMAVAFATVDLANAQARALNLAMSPRQLQLNVWYAYFAAEEYEVRAVGWNGMRVPSMRERDGLYRQTAVPPGYYDAGGLMDMVPLEHRRPDVEQHFTREVVQGFTDQLFGVTAHPSIAVPKQDDATTWLADLAGACSYWQRWAVARNLAGAMGSVGMTFKFRDGRLIVEVHDPRWCTPKVTDQATGDCAQLEIRYAYPREVRLEDGTLREVWHWYRRVIDHQTDTVYKPAIVEPNKEPIWEVDELATVTHGLGFFPGVWIQNTEAQGVIDGEPDCKGFFGNSEAADRLLSQATTGAGNNADPTLHVATDDTTLEKIRKGSRGAIRTEKGGAVSYVEHGGGGSDAALRVFEVIDTVNCRGTRYVRLQDHEGSNMTAEEVKRRMGPMLNAVESKRAHWTQTGIIPLTERIVRATRSLSARRQAGAGPNGETVLTALAIPMPGVVAGGELENQDISAAAWHLDVRWPPVIRSSPVDAQAAAQAVATARAAKVIDRASSVAYIAGPFGLDDTAAVIAELEQEDARAAAALESELLAGAPPAGDQPPDPNAAPAAAAGSVQDTALNGAQMAQLAAFAVLAFTGQLPRSAVLALARASLPMLPAELLEAGIPEPKPAEIALPGVPGAPPPAAPAPAGAPPPPPPPGAPTP